ncbi:unnamed protein product [Vitrella brassicaformis CCMP3155]|uniref:Uncharacterized protein n=1 Tax=Vitrella brassicaformis (strain CCMP3155) TaxID=1169540 RepID=A0A0G4G3Q8_VITBC|nr:unnamed protein product [Vitrella brassicaformis CCMP3155]|eukprot:CEM22795.1 unnamed protein product [Vitrella brassicaformis CCMP3155]
MANIERERLAMVQEAVEGMKHPPFVRLLEEGTTTDRLKPACLYEGPSMRKCLVVCMEELPKGQWVPLYDYIAGYILYSIEADDDLNPSASCSRFHVEEGSLAASHICGLIRLRGAYFIRVCARRPGRCTSTISTLRRTRCRGHERAAVNITLSMLHVHRHHQLTHEDVVCRSDLILVSLPTVYISWHVTRILIDQWR